MVSAQGCGLVNAKLDEFFWEWLMQPESMQLLRQIIHNAEDPTAEMSCVVWAMACLRAVVAEADDIGCLEEEAALSLRQLRVKGQSRDGEQDSVDSQSSELELGLGLDSSTADVVDLSSDADSTKQAGMPMISYPKEYCKHCGEMAFCHRASNPGCGGYATSGVASFNNRIRAQGCTIGPVLTVPRSYVRDISALAKTPGGFETLVQMLQSGFRLYEGKGHSGPVPQVSSSPHQLHIRGSPVGGRPSPPGSPHRTNVGFSREGDAEPSSHFQPSSPGHSPPVSPVPGPPPPKETDVLSPPPEHPISPGSGPTGVKNSMIATNAKTIPRFWWPKRDQISELGQEYKDQIHDIFVKQGITDGLKNWEQCEQIVTDVFKLSKYFAAPIFHKMKAFYDIVDRSAISKRDAMMVPTPVPITEMMVVGWANRKIQPDDPTLSFFSVVKKDHNDWIEKEDFDVFLHAILMTHPGLDFLLDTQEFQDRYADTVTSRIFYIYDRKGTGRIYLQNLRRYQPSIVETWKQLEDYDDMKMIRDYFSYEHFYVIYCTFWELDSDHDFLLDKDDLLKYDGHALSRRTVDRIFSEVTWRFTSAVPGKMGYEDFIHFLLNDQDQITDRSIEFWFNIFDLDADGVVRDYELKFFYEEQVQRMECLNYETIAFCDVLCQLHDMICPRVAGEFRLADFKRKRKFAGSFFSIFTSLNKFMAFENRDPFQAKQEQMENPNSTSWHRWCADQYLRLAMEEGEDMDEGQADG
ncbi:B''BETA [Symbiodinium sp. CCMP2592]|nr:B''BETA [Symbiodinium sp. CCMP2592]